MDTLYSVTLLISLAAGAAAIVLALLPFVARTRRVPPTGNKGSGRSHPASTFLIFLALASLALSLVVHLVFGHRPHSPDALGLIEFFSMHPAFIVAGALPVTAAALGRLAPGAG